jgi:alpha-tubulin suppressor-like RCC1 family protein
VYGFGDNEYGQLAQGDEDNINRGTPTRVELLGDKKITEIYVGGYFNIVRTGPNFIAFFANL